MQLAAVKLAVSFSNVPIAPLTFGSWLATVVGQAFVRRSRRDRCQFGRAAHVNFKVGWSAHPVGAPRTHQATLILLAACNDSLKSRAAGRRLRRAGSAMFSGAAVFAANRRAV